MTLARTATERRSDEKTEKQTPAEADSVHSLPSTRYSLGRRPLLHAGLAIQSATGLAVANGSSLSEDRLACRRSLDQGLVAARRAAVHPSVVPAEEAPVVRVVNRGEAHTGHLGVMEAVVGVQLRLPGLERRVRGLVHGADPGLGRDHAIPELPPRPGENGVALREVGSLRGRKGRVARQNAEFARQLHDLRAPLVEGGVAGRGRDDAGRSIGACLRNGVHERADLAAGPGPRDERVARRRMTDLELKVKRARLSEKRSPQAESDRVVSQGLSGHDEPVIVDQTRNLPQHPFPHPLRGDAAFRVVL